MIPIWKKLKRLETAKIDELNSILQSIGKNKNVISLDFTLVDGIIDSLLELIDEELQEYLCESYEDELSYEETLSTSKSFIKKMNQKDISFFEPYFENVSNFKNYNRWLFSYSSEMEFAYWAEFNFNLFFDDNFTLKNQDKL